METLSGDIALARNGSLTQTCTSSNGFLGGDLSPSTNPSNDTPNTNMQSLHTISNEFLGGNGLTASTDTSNKPLIDTNGPHNTNASNGSLDIIVSPNINVPVSNESFNVAGLFDVCTSNELTNTNEKPPHTSTSNGAFEAVGPLDTSESLDIGSPDANTANQPPNPNEQFQQQITSHGLLVANTSLHTDTPN